MEHFSNYAIVHDAGRAAENDIVSGCCDGYFGPSDNITREQLAVILHPLRPE